MRNVKYSFAAFCAVMLIVALAFSGADWQYTARTWGGTNDTLLVNEWTGGTNFTTRKIQIKNLFGGSNQTFYAGDYLAIRTRGNYPAQILFKQFVHDGRDLICLGANTGDIVIGPDNSGGVFQIGNSGSAGTYVYFQYGSVPTATYPLGFSQPLEFRSLSTNSTAGIIYHYPGITGFPSDDRSENGKLVFYARAPHWNFGNADANNPDVPGTAIMTVSTNGIEAAAGYKFRGDGSALTGISGGSTAGVTDMVNTLDMDGNYLCLRYTNGVLSSTNGYDSDATNFFGRSGITSGSLRVAVNELVRDCIASNIWTLGRAVYPLVGGTSNAHAMNLKSSSFAITYTSSGVTHNANGITGDGATGYGNLGFNPYTDLTDSNSVSLYVYSRSPTAVALSYLVGASLSGKAFGVRQNSGSDAPINGFVASLIGSTFAAGLGGSRTNGSGYTLYENGTALNYIATANTTPNAPVYVMARDDGEIPGPSNYSTNNISFVWIGTGMSASQMNALHVIVQRFQTRLGRNNP